MQIVVNLLGGLLAFGWSALAADFFTGARRERSLSVEPPYPEKEDEENPGPPPSLSVVLAACNEEEKLPAAFRSLLAQNYPGPLEIIAVDDRSTDATPALLDALAREAAAPAEGGKRVVILHLTALPPGWLGKTHALWQGAQQASGRWILFTDADIVFAPDCLSRAARYAETQNLHHLVSFFRLDLRGFAENAFGLCFTLLFTLRYRPWHVRNPRKSNYLGVGGFNMVRRDAYEGIGTHRALALAVADDMELGRRIKQAGFTSDVIGAGDRIRVRWQEGLGGLMGGLIKNAYAALHYSWALTLASSVMLILTMTWPFAGVFLARSRYGRAGYGACLGSILAIGGFQARKDGIAPGYALTLPFTSLLFVAVMARSAFVTERNRGITWRGTFYPLALLRAAAVPPVPEIIAPAASAGLS